ncbi:plasma membrane proteolipid 3-like [Durio zibethinus]|uniref:Plasma membrane proteolipid 3-like n=1 Tax=Durio zibethinus TaxID=66656 RepID=A0A6P6A3R6_DURZI|nr:plasma membrane proteolipid 3-like [Durio zibethinus]
MCLCIKCKCFSCEDSSGQEKKEPDCLDLILAILVPPVGVYKKEGGCTANFWVNVALTALGYAPGSIHAAISISTN